MTFPLEEIVKKNKLAKESNQSLLDIKGFNKCNIDELAQWWLKKIYISQEQNKQIYIV